MGSRSEGLATAAIHHLSPFRCRQRVRSAQKRNGGYQAEKRRDRSRPTCSHSARAYKVTYRAGARNLDLEKAFMDIVFGECDR